MLAFALWAFSSVALSLVAFLKIKAVGVKAGRKMNRLITQAVVFGVAVTETAGNPVEVIPGGLSIFGGAQYSDGQDGFDPAHVSFEYMNQCAEANLDKGSCLVSKTLDALMEMETGGPQTSSSAPSSSRLTWNPTPALTTNSESSSPTPVSSHLTWSPTPSLTASLKSSKIPTGNPTMSSTSPRSPFQDFPPPVPQPASSIQTWGPTPGSTPSQRRRFLQDDCSPPDITEQDLRNLMSGTKEQCIQSGASISDQEFESAASGFLEVFNAESCSEQLCSDEPNPLVLEIMFNEASKCAQVEPVINQCILDQVLFAVGGGEVSGANGDVDRIRRKLQDSSSCDQPSEDEMALLVSSMLMDVGSKCSELGTPVSAEEIDNATSDLTKIFMAQHCWGVSSEGCEANHYDDALDNFPSSSPAPSRGHLDDDEHDDFPSSSPAPSRGHLYDSPTDQEFNHANIYFEFMNQCAEANLDKDSCLISKTLDTLMEMIMEMETGGPQTLSQAPSLSRLTWSPTPSLMTNSTSSSLAPVSSHLTWRPTPPPTTNSKSSKIPTSSPTMSSASSRSPSHGLQPPVPQPASSIQTWGQTLGSTPSQRRRFLQDDCSPLDISEQDLRNLMSAPKEQCTESGLNISDQEFESAVSGVLKVFDAESCSQQLCSDEPNPVLLEIMFDEAAKCAQVEPDINQCIMDHVLFAIGGGEDSEENGDVNRIRRKLQDSSSCDQPNESEVAWFITFMLMDAGSRCSELGTPVSSEDLGKATSDLTKIFAAQHCWGEVMDGCEDNHDGDAHDDHHDDNHTDQEFNHAVIYFQFMNQCAEANLDMDACLVSETFNTFMEMDGSDDDHDNARRRFLQEDCSGPPGIDEQSLRYIMNVSKLQCIGSGTSVSDQEFESTVSEFLKIFNSSGCAQQLCEEESNPSGLLLEIMFEEAAKCAQVEPDINHCIMDQVFELLLVDENSDVNSEAGRTRRKLSHTVDGQDSPSCDQPSETEVAWFVSLMLMEAKAKCFELGTNVTSEEIYSATSDLTTIFVAQHCWGNDGCDDNHDDNAHDDHGGRHNDNSTSDSNGMNLFNIAIKYVEQCSGMDLNMETCLATKTIGTFSAWGVAPSGSSKNDYPSDQPSGRRFLQTSSESGDQCAPPDVNELTLRFIIEESKQQCIGTGIDIPDQEFEDTVDDFLGFFGADNCWEALCDEESNPSEMLLRIIFEEIGKCSGADFDFNPCLLDQMIAIMFSSESPDAFNGVRRKLEDTFGSPEENNPCAEHPDESELSFLVSLLLAGAQEQCMQLGETFEAGEIVKAQSDLMTVLGAQHCWGVLNDCNDNHDDHYGEEHGSYLEFIEQSTTWMLGQCAGVEEISCVFSRSIEVMHGIRLGLSHDGHNAPHHLAQQTASSICLPPTDQEYDIEQIATHAKEHCVDIGALVLDQHQDQVVNDLENLMTKPHCWESLCEPEIKDAIVEEWMHTCAFTDLKFLTTQGPYVSGDVSLDSDVLRCMAHYIASKHSEPAPWACSVPHLGLGNGVCDVDSGREAYIHCGGEVTTASPSTSLPSRTPTSPPSPYPTTHPSSSLAPSHPPSSLAPTHLPSSLATTQPPASLTTTHLPTSLAPSHLTTSPAPSHSTASLAPSHPQSWPPSSPPSWLPSSPPSWPPSSPPSSPPSTPPSLLPTMQFSMSFAYEQVDDFNWAQDDDEPETELETELERSLSYVFVQPDDGGFSIPSARRLREIPTLQGHGDDGDHSQEHDATLQGHEDDGDHAHNDDYYFSMPYDDSHDDWQGHEDNDEHWHGHDDDYRFSMSYDYHLSMPPDDWMPNDDGYDDGYDHDHEPEMLLYIEEVCALITDLNAEPAQQCLRPVCDLGIEDAFEDLHQGDDDQVDDDWHSQDDWNWNDHDDDHILSMPNDDWSNDGHDRDDDYVFSMPHDDGWNDYQDDWHDDDYTFSMPYDDEWSDDYDNGHDDDDNWRNDDEYTMVPTVAMTLFPTPSDTSPTPSPSAATTAFSSTPPTSESPMVPVETTSPTTAPTTMPTAAPTAAPTNEITSFPTLKPTTSRTRSPTPTPTVIVTYGSVMVSIDVEITLDGVEMTDIDITSLDNVVDLLESVMEDMLPEGATIRILSIGGFSVTRRLLRYLQETGVAVEFEIIMEKTCASAECDTTETDEISATFEAVTADFKEKVESGALETSIQVHAEEKGVEQLSNVTINASKMQVSEAKVTVKKGETGKRPVDDDGDDDSACARAGEALSIFAVFVSMVMLLHA